MRVDSTMVKKFEVVVSGMSGRFPDCDDMHTLKQKLYNKEEFLTVDNRKWPVGYKYKFGEKLIPDTTGKFTKVHECDYRVFKMNQLFAKSSDVLNRKVLEPTFEAIVDAGINPYSLDGQNVGVFMSCSIDDAENSGYNPKSDVLFLIGSSKTMISNRISYVFNLTGPSFTYFTDPHGGMESLATGYKYISEGFVDAAVVGAPSSIIEPKLGLQYVALGLLSPDGLTRALDKSANGYGRSEGVVVFYLQRAEDAKRNYGIIKFCDTYYYGSNPSTPLGYDEHYLGTAFERIYERHNYTEKHFSEVAFVEMAAYGCKRQEQIESSAVANIFCKNRSEPLLVGSVKSNTGHTEAAAALMSVLKALMALDTGVIAPNKDFFQINDNIEPLKDGRLKVVASPTDLPGKTVAVNSIGIFGTVCQTIIQQSSKDPITDPSVHEKIPRLLLICGRSEDDLRAVIEKIEFQPYNANSVALANDVFTQLMPMHIFRGYTILPKPFKAVREVEERGDIHRPVWFVFSGMGSQWNGMGKGLLDLPIFAGTVAKCNEVLQPKGIDIYNILTTEDATVFDNILNAFVGIITVQIGLVEVLKALGIKPDGIIGHSVGENACAYADGCFTLEQAVLASWARGIASLEAETIKGMMAAIGKGYNDIKPLLPKDIEVACHNSAESSTLTGPAKSVQKFVEQLQKEGVFAKAVNVANIAYHSKYISSAGPLLLPRLKTIIPNPTQRSSRWISTSVPESDWDTPLAKYCSAEYHTNNLLNPVLFEEGCKHIPTNALVIELAPHGLLQAILKRSLPKTCTNVPLTFRTRTRENLNFLLSAIGKLYIAGLQPNVNNLFPKIEYPVPRQTPSISQFCTWHHDPEDVCPKHLKRKEDTPLSNESILISIREDSEYAYLKHHKIKNEIIIPPSFFMYLTWWMHSYQRNEKVGTSSVIFEDVKIHQLITVSLEDSKSVSIMIQYGSGDFEVLLENPNNVDEVQIIISGRIITVLQNLITTPLDAKLLQNGKVKVNGSRFYNAYETVGYQLTDCFMSIQELSITNTDYFGKITWNHNWVALLDSLMKFQMFSEVQTNKDLLPYPYRIRKLTIQSPELSSLGIGSTLLYHADQVTRKVVGKGIEMLGLQYEIMSQAACRYDVKLQGLRFVSHGNPNCQNIEEFVSLCLQLAVENLSTINGAGVKLQVDFSASLAHGNYSRIIKNMVENDDYLKYYITFCSLKDVKDSKTCLNDKYFMLVTDAPQEAIEIHADHLLILAVAASIELQIDSSVLHSFSVVTKQTFSGHVISLLKRNLYENGQKPVVLFDNENSITHQHIHHDDHKSSPVFLLRYNIKPSDLTFMLTKQKRHSNIRYLYMMNPANACKLTETSLKKQLIQDLPIAVCQQGEWGSYRNLSNSYNQEESYQIEESFLDDLCLSSVEVDSVYLDVDHWYNKKDYKERGIGYSGTLHSGEKIMGLATISSNESASQFDSYLSWHIPNEWNMEQAVTVPYNYSQAYNILYSDSIKSITKSVLINVETEDLLAETCISLSLHEGYEVYVAVANDQDAANIQQKFPKLKTECLLNRNRCSYDAALLLQTRGKGVDLVISFLPGAEHVEALLNCVATYGHCVKVGENNAKYDIQLGLNAFLNSIAFVTVSNKISSLLSLDEERKKYLNKLVEDGIRNGVVIPSKIIQNKEGLKSTITKSHKMIKCCLEKEMSVTDLKPKYDSRHSYIVIGEGRRNNSWFDLIKLLIAKGARTFIVALENFTAGSKLSTQVNQQLSETKATIILTSSSRLDNIQGATQLVAEAGQVAPLEAVFFISLDSAERKIRHIDAAISPNVHLVCLFSGGLEECSSRRFKGSPAILIHGEKSEDIAAVFQEVDKVMANPDNNNAYVLYQVVNPNLTCVENTTNTTLHDYFPKNIDAMSTFGSALTEKINFVEMTSLGLRFKETRGVYPVFVLPVQHGTALGPLIRNLLYPVFCATPVDSNAAPTDMAKDLLQSLNAIQPSGPVTLISETWNVNVALKLKSLIECASRPTKLFILEGNPIEWQERMKHLGAVNSVQFETNLVKELFHFDSKIQTEIKFDPTISFQEKVRQCASRYLIPGAVESVIRATNVIRKQLLQTQLLSLKDKMLSNVVMFQQYGSNHATLKLSVTSDIIVLNEPSYECFLRNPKISATINEQAVYSWWDYPVH